MALLNKQSISVFFPCYNDESSIKTLAEDAFSVLKQLTNRYEVLVINDGSTDGSGIVLKQLQKKYKKLRVISHKQNLGYGAALRSAFIAAKGDLIFYTDGDGQYDVNELPRLLSAMVGDINFVNGIKILRNDPIYRVIIGNIYSFFARLLFRLPILDVDCDFRLIKKSLVRRLQLESNSGAICIELVKKAQLNGGKFQQVPVHHNERRFGRSQFFRANRILTTLSEVARLWIKLVILNKLI